MDLSNHLTMVVTALVIAGLLAAVFLFSGSRKVVGGVAVAAEASHLGVPIGAYRLIGVAEVVAAAGLLIGFVRETLGIAAAAALTALMIGAVLSHVRVGDPVKRWAPAAVLTLLAAAGLVLRVASA